MKSTVVELRHRIADDHIGQLADSFPHERLSRTHFLTEQTGSDMRRSAGVHVENYAAFNLSAKSNNGRGALAPVAIDFHGEVRNLRRGLHHLRQYGVERADKRLNQFHPHRDFSSPAPTVAVTPSSLRT